MSHTGELHGLKWKYVDFERRLILIRETVVDGEESYTKTDSSQREIQMSQLVFDALKEQEKSTRKLSEFVFCNREGHPLDFKNVNNRVWKPLLRHLGLKDPRCPNPSSDSSMRSFGMSDCSGATSVLQLPSTVTTMAGGQSASCRRTGRACRTDFTGGRRCLLRSPHSCRASVQRGANPGLCLEGWAMGIPGIQDSGMPEPVSTAAGCRSGSASQSVEHSGAPYPLANAIRPTWFSTGRLPAADGVTGD